ncbi:hypothetical protein TCA2_3226 [Paenibacillus sp. TCA20]|nr:hypothetical protein TCA2_3226 [Paenibacillus sp. TCA20]
MKLTNDKIQSDNVRLKKRSHDKAVPTAVRLSKLTENVSSKQHRAVRQSADAPFLLR